MMKTRIGGITPKASLSVYDLKPRFQSLLRPVAARLARRGVSANMVTVTAATASVALGVFVAIVQQRWLLWLYPAFLVVRMALNAIDGMLARDYFQPTPLGALLNENGDLVSDAALYLPLAIMLPGPSWIVVSVVLVSLVGEATGIAAQTIRASRRYDGPLGKSDRALAFSALAVSTAAGIPAANLVVPIAAGALLGLAVLTVVNRGRAALLEAAQ